MLSVTTDGLWNVTPLVKLIVEEFDIDVEYRSELEIVWRSATMNRIKVKKGEAKDLKFTYKDADGVVIDMSSAGFTFVVKDEKGDDAYTIEKIDSDFDKTEAASGIVTVTLTKNDLDIIPKNYTAEVRAYFNDSDVDLSQDITLIVDTPVYG